MEKCDKCGLYLDGDECMICSSEKRQSSSTICVVEGMTDCMAIEASEQYFGLYHILGGVLNPLLGIGPDELGLDRLTDRVKQESIKNVILAVTPSVEGDATCAYIKSELSNDVKVERIGFGIPMGGSFEYLDSLTIMKALENRKRM
jgi:recombination protein RecR